MASGFTPDIDVEQVKWVVLMVLFSQPGQEVAFSRMEDLVYSKMNLVRFTKRLFLRMSCNELSVIALTCNQPMSNNIVVVESPAKAKTIEKYLGK